MYVRKEETHTHTLSHSLINMYQIHYNIFNSFNIILYIMLDYVNLHTTKYYHIILMFYTVHLSMPLYAK